jgi:hypothetical protein
LCSFLLVHCSFLETLTACNRIVLRDGWHPERIGGAAEFHKQLLQKQSAFWYVAFDDIQRIERWSKEMEAEAAKPKRRWWLW